MDRKQYIIIAVTVYRYILVHHAFRRLGCGAFKVRTAVTVYRYILVHHAFRRLGCGTFKVRTENDIVPIYCVKRILTESACS